MHERVFSQVSSCRRFDPDPSHGAGWRAEHDHASACEDRTLESSPLPDSENVGSTVRKRA